MIERLNFYDLYGYLLPGIVLSAAIWVPLGLSGYGWPPAELSSAILAVVLGYVLGTLLHEISRDSLLVEQIPLPSTRILDQSDRTFSSDAKARLAAKIKSAFNVDVQGKSTDLAVSARRQAAFELCRAEVLQAKQAGYSEQMQGMYALMRSIGIGALLAASWYSGWLLVRYGFVSSDAAMVRARWAIATVPMLLMIRALLVHFRRRGHLRDKGFAVAIHTLWFAWVALLLLAGLVFARAAVVEFPDRNPRVGIAIVCALCVFVVSWSAYFRYATEFARHVYVQFDSIAGWAAPGGAAARSGGAATPSPQLV